LVELRRSLEAQVHLAVRQILSAVPGVCLPDAEAGAYLLSLFLESLFEDYILHRREHTDFGDERIIAAASDMVLRSLLGRLD
jgi:hypothetical protein